VNDSAAIVVAENLTRKFKNATGEVTAVDHLNLTIAPGEIFALVGPDGAGKTTTMRMLCGLMDPTEGKAIVTGLDVKDHPDEVKDHIGYMAQRFGLYTDLTVSENMNFYADLFGILGQERKDLSSRLLKMTRMEPFKDRHAGKLSGGMKQKLALMCTLLHKPRVLFLDEPTNGVDPVSRRDFWAILYQLVRDGLTVMVATAYLDEAERANSVGMMHLGRMVRCATPSALRSELAEACYSLTSHDLRKTRHDLEGLPGVVGIQPSGADLHLFLDESKNSVEQLKQHTPFKYRRIAPSLEDVFIAVVGREETARAA
jgi:ABC-2 type transport system ATP-binding protein